eukprot:3217818-Rhodomonas_salina.1
MIFFIPIFIIIPCLRLVDLIIAIAPSLLFFSSIQSMPSPSPPARRSHQGHRARSLLPALPPSTLARRSHQPPPPLDCRAHQRHHSLPLLSLVDLTNAIANAITPSPSARSSISPTASPPRPATLQPRGLP